MRYQVYDLHWAQKFEKRSQVISRYTFQSDWRSITRPFRALFPLRKREHIAEHCRCLGEWVRRYAKEYILNLSGLGTDSLAELHMW
jgi:hypothetical protein